MYFLKLTWKIIIIIISFLSQNLNESYVWLKTMKDRSSASINQCSTTEYSNTMISSSQHLTKQQTNKKVGVHRIKYFSNLNISLVCYTSETGFQVLILMDGWAIFFWCTGQNWDAVLIRLPLHWLLGKTIKQNIRFLFSLKSEISAKFIRCLLVQLHSTEEYSYYDCLIT